MKQSSHILKRRRDIVDALFSGQGSLDEILGEHGILPGDFFQWLDEPQFADYLKKQTHARTEAALLSAWKALLLGVERGETSAIKLFFELKSKESGVTESFDVHLDNLAKEAAL